MMVMPAGKMLQSMMLSHEGSTSLTVVVELGHGAPDPEESLSLSATLKLSHWKNVKKADACSGPKCQKKFGRMDHHQNYCMCGVVFCQNCTQFRRKLSPGATPDPELEVQCCVCGQCHDYEDKQKLGQHFHWTPAFSFLRAQLTADKNAQHATASSLLLSALSLGDNDHNIKTNQVQWEMQRLCQGYRDAEGNSGCICSFILDIFRIPAWQKSSHWVDDSQAHQCHKCHNTFRKLQSKTNCRVCGQVYCKHCSNDQIILYMTESDTNAKWGINAYSPMPEYQRFALLPVCVDCTLELKEILRQELESQLSDDWDAPEDFMDSLMSLHTVLHRIKSCIDSWLPQYKKLVDFIDGATHFCDSKNPINDIAKSQSNLLDQFSYLASEYQKLHKMKPLNSTQERMLKYVTMATYSFYQENMYMFRAAHQRLGELMPVETLDAIQMAINKMSIERVHILIRQLTFEAMNLEMSYKLVSNSITLPLLNCVDILEQDMEQFFNTVGDNWTKHCEAVHQMIREDFQGTGPDGQKRRRIKLPDRLPCSPFHNVILQYKILTQCSHLLNECMRELSAKTPELFMEDVKAKVKGVVTEFTRQVTALRSNHPQVFSRALSGVMLTGVSPPLSPTNK